MIGVYGSGFCVTACVKISWVVDVDSITIKPAAHSFNKTDLIGGDERMENTVLPG
jgi:hypothetical protein